jgi:hypothetical protein
LTDFGTALSLMRRNAILGLPAQQGIPENGISLSPEQLEQGSATLHSDIFSLARTLAHCLHDDEAEQDPHLAVAHGPMRPSVPASISGLLQRALSTDPSERIPTAADFYEQLMESMVKARLRWSRAAVLDWLNRSLHPESASQRPGQQVPLPVATPAASVPAVREVSVLVLTLASEPSATLKLRIEQLLGRAANGSHWASGQQLCAVFQQPDGRDAEIAVRTALALLRALGGVARSSNLAIDLSSYPPSLFNTEGDFTDPPALAQWAQVLGHSDWHHAGRVVVSRQTTRELRALFRLKRVHKFGFAIVGSRRVDHASGPFFGRHDALYWLSEFTTQLCTPGASPPAAIAVIGDAGIGKTRLLLQLNDLLREANSTVRLCIAACPVRGRTLAYSAVLTLLARLCDIREGDVAPRAQQSHPALVHVDAEDLARATELLSAPPAPTDELDVELGALLTRVVVARATRCPQVLVVDAAHQMDDASRRILARAVASDLGKNALLVLLSRELSLLE